MNRTPRLGRDAFHRVRDFSSARSLAQARVLGGSRAFGNSIERCGIDAGAKENSGTRWNTSLPGSWRQCMC